MAPARPIRGLISCVALAWLLAGCGGPLNKTYREPSDPDGQACLEVCRADRARCQRAVQAEDDRCEQAYDYRYARWRACVLERGERRCAAFRPLPCGAAAYGVCSERYDRCFLGCGGRIDTDAAAPAGGGT